MVGRPLSFPPVSLSLSRYINNSPCLSTTQSWRFFPSDKVSRSFYKLIRVCSLWSRQLWTRRIDLAGESAVPDHDFKQNPMFLWRGRPSPEQYPYYPSIWLVQSGGGGGADRKYPHVVEEVKMAEVGFWGEQRRVKSAADIRCDWDVELITGNCQVDRLILRLDVVLFYFKSGVLQLCCNGCDAVWIIVHSL